MTPRVGWGFLYPGPQVSESLLGEGGLTCSSVPAHGNPEFWGLAYRAQHKRLWVSPGGLQCIVRTAVYEGVVMCTHTHLETHTQTHTGRAKQSGGRAVVVPAP